MKTAEDLWQLYISGNHSEVLSEAGQKLVSDVDFLHICGMSLVNMNRGNEGAALLRAAAVIKPEYPHLFANAAVAFFDNNGMIESEAFAR